MTVASVLTAVALAELAAAVLVVAAIMALALGLAVAERRDRPRARSSLALIRHALDRDLDAREIGELARLGGRAQVRALAQLAPSLAGEQRHRLGTLALQLGIVARASRLCRSRLWWRRLHGARLLTLAAAGQEIMPRLLADPNALVRAQAAEWASDHPDPATLASLIATLDDPQRIARFTVQDSLLRVGHRAVEPLAERLTSLGPLGQQSGLVVASRLADPRFLPIALTLAEHPAPAVRMAAARVLGALGGDDSVRVLQRLLADADAGVRANAAAGLGRSAHWPSAALLRSRLSDPSWTVRRESALALRAMGAPGAVMLRTAVAGGDRFAADIAAQALETGG